MIHKEPLNSPKNWNPAEIDEDWEAIVSMMKESNSPTMPSQAEYQRLWDSIKVELSEFPTPIKQLEVSPSFTRTPLSHEKQSSGFMGWLDVLIFEGGPYAQLTRFAAVFLTGFFLTKSFSTPNETSPAKIDYAAHSSTPAPDQNELAQPSNASDVETPEIALVDPTISDKRFDFPTANQSPFRMVSTQNDQLIGMNRSSESVTPQSNSPFAKQRLLNSLQQMKFNSYVENNGEDLNRIREIESNIAVILRNDHTLPDTEVNGIQLFQKGDQFLQEKNYAESILYFTQCRELVPGSFLAFLAQFRIATVKFEYLQQFDEALLAYEETLREYPAHFISGDQKRFIISQVNLMKENQQPNWDALELWIIAKHGSVNERNEALLRIITEHGKMPIASQAAAKIAEELFQGASMLEPHLVIEKLQLAIDLQEASQQRSSLEFYQAEILFRRLYDVEQARSKYIEILPELTGTRYESIINTRLAQLSK